jgi:integrase
VWTDHRVAAWRERGERSAVAVWTVQQLVAFFKFVADDLLYALWWPIALRGLRRGEAAGLRWTDVDLDARVIVIGQQRIAYGRTVTVGPPKTASSRRVIALDRVTARLLRTHLRQQRAEGNAAGDAWQDSGYVFTTPDGAALHPDYLTRRFGRLVDLSGLPPVRLHDLRHGAATLGPRHRRRPQDRAGTARARQHRPDRRHLHQRPARPALQDRRSGRPPRPRGRGPQPRQAPPPANPNGPAKSAAPQPASRPQPRRPKRSRRTRTRQQGRPRTTHGRPTKIKTA